MPTGRPAGRGAAAAYVVDVAEGEPVPGQRLHRRQPEDAPPAKQTTASERCAAESPVVGRVQTPMVVRQSNRQWLGNSLDRLLRLRRRLHRGTAVGRGRVERDRAAGAQQLPDDGECRGGSGKAHAGKAPAAGREAGGDEGPQQRRQLVGEAGGETSGVSETVTTRPLRQVKW